MFKIGVKYSFDTIAPTILGVRLLNRERDFVNLKCISVGADYSLAILIEPSIDDINKAVYELRHDLVYKPATELEYLIFETHDKRRIALAKDWIDINTVRGGDEEVYVTATWTMSNTDKLDEIKQFLLLLGINPEIKVSRT